MVASLVMNGAAEHAEHAANATMRKHCNDLAADVWHVCKVQKQKELCSPDCETMLRTATLHQSLCSSVVVSPSETFGDTIRSHLSFRQHYCTQDGQVHTHRPSREAATKVDAQECYTRSDREDYRGHVNTTIGGYTCQKWSLQIPHKHSHMPSQENEWQGLGDHNYCRSLSWDSCAWCFTTERHPKWECCLIGSPQPSCPTENGPMQMLPAALSDAHRHIFNELVAGRCPRMLIMLKMAPMSVSDMPAVLGWYEVVSEQSKGIGEGEAFLVAGHHNHLPGQTVADEVRGRLNVRNNGVFRCTMDGLFFEPKPVRTADGTLQPQLPRTKVSAMQVPELNGNIIELVEFKAVETNVSDASGVELPFWQRAEVKTVLITGVSAYIISMAFFAAIAYACGRRGQTKSSTPISPRAGGRPHHKDYRGHGGYLASSPGGLPAHPTATWREDRLDAKESASTNRRLSYPNGHRPTAAGGGRNGRHGSAPGPGAMPVSSVDYVQSLPIDQAINLRRVHDMAATTIQRQVRSGSNGRLPVPPGPEMASHGYDYGYGYGYGDGDGGHGPGHTASGRPPPIRAGAAYGATDGPLSSPQDGVLAEGEVKRLLVPFFRALGIRVALYPWRTVWLAIISAVVLTSGLAFMTFEADSSMLYLPQRSEMALTRQRYAEQFGALPDALMLIVKRRAGGSLVNKPSLSSALALYEQITEIRAEQIAPPGSGMAVPYQPIVLSDFCVHRYVHQLGEYRCGVSSLLELWQYSQRSLDGDDDVERTVWEAHRQKVVDLGEVDVDDDHKRISVQAFMLSLFFNVSAPAYSDGRFERWHRQLRQRLPLIAQREGLTVTWWSTRLNEEEANSFVRKDSPLLFAAFAFVFIYVTVSLSKFRCGDDAHVFAGSGVRLMLSLSCALCSGLSMSAGFGLTSYLGVPISPVTPLVSFMLLGVSVDNMIIIVDTFDRRSDAEDVPYRLSRSLAESGTAITVTTFTTLVAFLTGLWVDLPVYAWFCATAACCVACLYALQLTLFCGLLVIDTNNRIAAARAYLEAEDDAWEEAWGDAPGGKTGHHDLTPPLGPQHGQAPGPPPPGHGKPGRFHVDLDTLDARQSAMHWYANWLLFPPIRFLVIVAYLAPVVFALFVVRDLQPGLPYRQTVPEDSIIMNFLDDVDTYYAGSFPVKVVVVFENTDPTMPEEVSAVASVLDAMLELPYVNRIASNWLEDYVKWAQCMDGDYNSICTLRLFLDDGEMNMCAANSSSYPMRRRLGDGKAAGAAQTTALAPLAVTDVDADAFAHVRRRLGHGHAKQHGHKGHHGGRTGRGDDAAAITSCSNQEERFGRLSGGHVCDEAVSRCESGTGWRVVRSLCPVTCGVCDGDAPGGNATGVEEEQSIIFGGKDYEGDVLLKELTPGGCAADEFSVAGVRPACESGRGCIIGTHRFVVSAVLPQNMEQSFYIWRELTRVFEECGARARGAVAGHQARAHCPGRSPARREAKRTGYKLSGYVYHVRFEYGYFDHTILFTGLKNLLVRCRGRPARARGFPLTLCTWRLPQSPRW